MKNETRSAVSVPIANKIYCLSGLFVIHLLVMLFFASPASCKEIVMQAKAGDYYIEATIARYPLSLGDNSISVKIADESGRGVNDAEVTVNYYMPPMPRMAPMNYKTEASPKGGCYNATMNIIMAGPWYVRIIIKEAGHIATAKFNADAQ